MEIEKKVFASAMYHLRERMEIAQWRSAFNDSKIKFQVKNIKCDYCQPLWIYGDIKISLKQRSKSTKIFNKNGLRKRDHIKEA